MLDGGAKWSAVRPLGPSTLILQQPVASTEKDLRHPRCALPASACAPPPSRAWPLSWLAFTSSCASCRGDSYFPSQSPVQRQRGRQTVEGAAGRDWGAGSGRLSDVLMEAKVTAAVDWRQAEVGNRGGTRRRRRGWGDRNAKDWWRKKISSGWSKRWDLETAWRRGKIQKHTIKAENSVRN